MAIFSGLEEMESVSSSRRSRFDFRDLEDLRALRADMVSHKRKGKGGTRRKGEKAHFMYVADNG